MTHDVTPVPQHDPQSDPTPLSDTATGSKRAVVYLRVSTARQANRDGEAEGYSIPAQRTACWQKAAALGAQVVKEYVDAGASARSADRPALNQLLDRLRTSRDIDYVIVHKIDRLARDRADDVTIGLTIRTAGATLISASEQIDDTPAGMLLHAIMAGVAEFYSQNLGHEAKKGMRTKAEKGGTPGYCPLGYLNVTDRIDGHEVKTVKVDPDRGHHITWMFEAYATGEWSIGDLVDELKARGMRSRPTVKFSPTPLTRSQVHRILQSPYYLGHVVHKGVLFEGRHQPLVDPDTFDRVQAIRAVRRHAGDRSWKIGHYLVGSLYCTRCGQRLCYGASRGKNGSAYGYFFCLGRNKKRTDCDLPYLPEAEVIAAVEAHWNQEVIATAAAERIRTRVEQYLDLQTKTGHQVVTQQQKRLKALQRTQAKLVDAYLADAIPVDELKKRQDQTLTEIADAERQIADATADQTLIRERLDIALKLLDRCGDLYRTCDKKQRRFLNQAVYRRLYVDHNGVTNIERTSPFAELQAAATEHTDTAQQPAQKNRRARRSATEPETAAQSSNVPLLAEGVGFEPTET